MKVAGVPETPAVTPEQIFSVVNLLALAGWVLLAVLPGRAWVSKAIAAGVMPVLAVVYTGLIDKLKTTDDELAAVIGHEISHALREHGRERMSIAAVQQVGLVGLAAIASTSKSPNAAGVGVQAAALGSNLFFAMPNGREQEREADRMGLELAARAGYNPNAAVTLWQKMSAQGGDKPPEFLSTDLKSLIPGVMPLYEQAKAGK